MRRAVLAFVLGLLILGAPVAGGAQNSFAGTWRGFVTVNGMQCTFDLVMMVNGTYNEMGRCGTLATGQSGTYRAFSNGTLSRTVTNWTPRQRYIVGAQVGTGHWEDNARPPGGTFQVTFSNPNTMIWRDVNFGGSITYRRVR
jgi:hypothetical protein